jgi:hypothetical protein
MNAGFREQLLADIGEEAEAMAAAQGNAQAEAEKA